MLKVIQLSTLSQKKKTVPKSIGGNSGGWVAPNLARFFGLKIAALSNPKSGWAGPSKFWPDFFEPINQQFSPVFRVYKANPTDWV